jgi:hypothetical protein
LEYTHQIFWGEQNELERIGVTNIGLEEKRWAAKKSSNLTTIIIYGFLAPYNKNDFHKK